MKRGVVKITGTRAASLYFECYFAAVWRRGEEERSRRRGAVAVKWRIGLAWAWLLLFGICWGHSAVPHGLVV